MVIKIGKLRGEDLSSVVKFISSNIDNVSYYSDVAKKAEKQKYNKTNLLSKIKNKNFIFYVAKCGKNVVGILNGHYDEDIFWVSWLIVHENFRRMGVAGSLLNSLFNLLVKNNVHKVWFDTRTDNKESISLVKKLKCQKIGVVKNHWHKQDYFLWQKFL